MRRILAVAVSCSLLTGCAAMSESIGGSRRHKHPEPDLEIRLTDATFGWEIGWATIAAKVTDTRRARADTAYWLDYAVYGFAKVAGSEVALTITCEDYMPVETTVAVQAGVRESLVIALTQTVVATGLPNDTAAFYRQGWDEAAADLDSNNACYYRMGGLPGGESMISEYTGLPVRGNWSCMVTTWDELHSEGYNDRVYLYISRHGLPANSKKKWLPEILNPRKYFDSVAAVFGTLRLELEGDEIPSPIARHSVALRRRLFMDSELEEILKPDSGKLWAQIAVEDNVNWITKYDYLTLGVEERFVDVVWGPEGSELMFVRQSHMTSVFELRQCDRLNFDFH